MLVLRPLDVIDRLDLAYDWTASRVAVARPDAMRRPTPCADWDLQALVAHLVQAADGLSAAAAGDAVSPPPAPPTDPGDAFAAVAARSMAIWRAPGVMERTCTIPLGAAPGAVVAELNVLEVVVHGWDVGRATGEAADIPADLAEPTLGFARQVLAAHPRGTGFAPEVDRHGSASDRLVAYLGRSW